MQAKPRPLSAADYLAREERGPLKSEYVDGAIYAVSGARRAHNLIAANLLARAWAAARQLQGCQVFGSDMRVHVEAHNRFYYPDLCVCCDPRDRHELFVSRPSFIVEVLSRATSLIDRWEKRASYATIDSVREYVVVDSERMEVEVYRREGTQWQAYLLEMPQEVMECSCLDLRLSLSQIYEGVDLAAPATRHQAQQLA
jgi:Uma2 family endonuclease